MSRLYQLFIITGILCCFAGGNEQPLSGSWDLIFLSVEKLQCVRYVDSSGKKYLGTQGLFKAIGENVTLTCDTFDTVRSSRSTTRADRDFTAYTFGAKDSLVRKTIRAGTTELVLSGKYRKIADTVTCRFDSIVDRCGTRTGFKNDSFCIRQVRCGPANGFVKIFRQDVLFDCLLSRDTLRMAWRNENRTELSRRVFLRRKKSIP